MRTYRLSRVAGVIVVGMAVFLLLESQVVPAQEREVAAQEKDVPPEAGVTVLGRGPIHEAFAQPFEKDPTPSPAVSKKPPDPIPEEPPDQKPEGEHVQWIPGYWAWDVDKNDFVWVSGVWRVVPAGRKWEPGHWTQTDQGWQWVPGFWSDAAQENFQYLPEPPASQDNGPSSPAPDDNSYYIPGYWQYRDTSYVWRPGFWSTAYDGWVWSSPSYRWTPAGYVFVDGYWDYPLAHRGLLFAPVYFDQPLWATSGWFYRPRYLVNVGLDSVFGSLFVWPGYSHYYFGDYYDARYLGLGLWPWYSYGYHRYDPLFAYHGWANRGDPNWFTGWRNDYWNRRNGQQPRPPHTFAPLSAQASNKAMGPQLITPLHHAASTDGSLVRLAPSQVAEQRTMAQRYREAANLRVKNESAAPRPAPRASPKAPPGRTTAPQEARAPRSVPSDRELQVDRPPATIPRPAAPSGPAARPRTEPPTTNVPAPRQEAPRTQAPAPRPQQAPPVHAAPPPHGGARPPSPPPRPPAPPPHGGGRPPGEPRR